MVRYEGEVLSADSNSPRMFMCVHTHTHTQKRRHIEIYHRRTGRKTKTISHDKMPYMLRMYTIKSYQPVAYAHGFLLTHNRAHIVHRVLSVCVCVRATRFVRATFACTGDQVIRTQTLSPHNIQQHTTTLRVHSADGTKCAHARTIAATAAAACFTQQ